MLPSGYEKPSKSSSRLGNDHKDYTGSTALTILTFIAVVIVASIDTTLLTGVLKISNVIRQVVTSKVPNQSVSLLASHFIRPLSYTSTHHPGYLAYPLPALS
jgi:hypothetical protein